MSYNINFNTLRKDSIQDNNDEKLLSINFPNKKKSSQRSEIKINKDILLSKNNLFFQEKTSITFKTKEPICILNISLNDGCNYNSNINNYKINPVKNNTTISYMKNETGCINVDSNSHIKTIAIEIKESFLLSNILEKDIDSLFLNNYNNSFAKCLKSKETNVYTKICAKELFDSPYHGKLNQIYLQSKVFEILFFEFKDLNTNNEKSLNISSAIFSNYDIEALHHAKDILLQNIQNPPSIVDLSKLVHINEFKLKIGFKKLFNSTPYNLLLEYRMQEAKILLETSDLNINEISHVIGYKFSQNFSKAFVLRFVVRPKDLMKNRKYY